MKASEQAGESVDRVMSRLGEIESHDLRFVATVLLLQMRLGVDALKALERIEEQMPGNISVSGGLPATGKTYTERAGSQEAS
jgi:hypothetical protein